MLRICAAAAIGLMAAGTIAHAQQPGAVVGPRSIVAQPVPGAESPAVLPRIANPPGEASASGAQQLVIPPDQGAPSGPALGDPAQVVTTPAVVPPPQQELVGLPPPALIGAPPAINNGRPVPGPGFGNAPALNEIPGFELLGISTPAAVPAPAVAATPPALAPADPAALAAVPIVTPTPAVEPAAATPPVAAVPEIAAPAAVAPLYLEPWQVQYRIGLLGYRNIRFVRVDPSYYYLLATAGDHRAAVVLIKADLRTGAVVAVEEITEQAAYPGPAYQPPAAYEEPAYQAPAFAAPVYRPPAYQAPAYRPPAYRPSYSSPAYRPSYQQPGYGYGSPSRRY